MTLSEIFGWELPYQNSQSWQNQPAAQYCQRGRTVQRSQELAALYNAQFNRQVAAPAVSGDCEGCGAPMKRYRSCCEYCRRVS